MKLNVGGVDKILKIIAGLAVISWGVATQNWWGAVGLVPLLTATVDFCLLCHLLGGCPRIENLLRKKPFWPFFPFIFVK